MSFKARETAQRDEIEVLESKFKFVKNKSSWIDFKQRDFRDKEKAQWVNSIIKKLWPNVGHYTENMLRNSILPAIKEALNVYGIKGRVCSASIQLIIFASSNFYAFYIPGSP